MCVVSMVHDYYKPIIPQPDYLWTTTTTTGPDYSQQIEQIKKLLREFREAVSAAETVDKLTGQPDCVDPAKLTLLERVERLERELGLDGEDQ